MRPPARAGSAWPTGTSSRTRSSPTCARPRPRPKSCRPTRSCSSVKCIKSAYEIAAIRQAYWITEQAMIEALDSVARGDGRVGDRGAARTRPCAGSARRARPTRSGSAPGRTPTRACAGPPTGASNANELVQLTFGARHMGYCGNMCRPFAIGKMPDRARDLMSVALEGVHGALADIRPGVSAKVVFEQLLQHPGEVRLRGVHPLRPGPRLRVVRGRRALARRRQRI